MDVDVAVVLDEILDVVAVGVAFTGGGVRVGGFAAILMTAGAGAMKAGTGGVSFDRVSDSPFSDLTECPCSCLTGREEEAGSFTLEGSRFFFGGRPRFGAFAPLSVFAPLDFFLAPLVDEEDDDVLWEDKDADGT